VSESDCVSGNVITVPNTWFLISVPSMKMNGIMVGN
jgi:hypothetical protein